MRVICYVVGVAAVAAIANGIVVSATVATTMGKCATGSVLLFYFIFLTCQYRVYGMATWLTHFMY